MFFPSCDFILEGDSVNVISFYGFQWSWNCDEYPTWHDSFIIRYKDIFHDLVVCNCFTCFSSGYLNCSLSDYARIKRDFLDTFEGHSISFRSFSHNSNIIVPRLGYASDDNHLWDIRRSFVDTPLTLSHTFRIIDKPICSSNLYYHDDDPVHFEQLSLF